ISVCIIIIITIVNISSSIVNITIVNISITITIVNISITIVNISITITIVNISITIVNISITITIVNISITIVNISITIVNISITIVTVISSITIVNITIVIVNISSTPGLGWPLPVASPRRCPGGAMRERAACSRALPALAAAMLQRGRYSRFRNDAAAPLVPSAAADAPGAPPPPDTEALGDRRVGPAKASAERGPGVGREARRYLEGSPRSRQEWRMNKLGVGGGRRARVEGGHLGGDDWNRNGSLVHKPSRGWLHADSNVSGAGVTYIVRYMGCIEVLQSMRTLDFKTRTHVTRYGPQHHSVMVDMMVMVDTVYVMVYMVMVYMVMVMVVMVCVVVVMVVMVCVTVMVEAIARVCEAVPSVKDSFRRRK
ncbi:unnamed protein product, partial [Lampetra fluviatilis]